MTGLAVWLDRFYIGQDERLHQLDLILDAMTGQDDE